jgi:hypothetical protein
MSSTDNALAAGVLALFAGGAYIIYKKFPNLFNSPQAEEPAIPLNSDDMAKSPNWTKLVTDETVTPNGDVIINYILDGSGKFEGMQFEGTDINPTPKPAIQATGDTIIGKTSQGYNIYETSLGTNPTLSDPTQYKGYIGNNTPAKVTSSSSKTIVTQAKTDDLGLSATDRAIQERAGWSDKEAVYRLTVDRWGEYEGD